MAEANSLADLGQAMGLAPAAGAAVQATPAVQKLDKQGRAYATGRRKNAIARVWIKRGKGKITVNGKPIETYFARPVLRMLVSQPLILVARATEYDLDCTVNGGGLSGQAGAVAHELLLLGPDGLTACELLQHLLSHAGYRDEAAEVARLRTMIP